MCFVGFCFDLLFNLCAVCMSDLLSIYKEPGSRGAVTLSNPNTFLGNSCRFVFLVAPPANSSVLQEAVLH